MFKRRFDGEVYVFTPMDGVGAAVKLRLEKSLDTICHSMPLPFTVTAFRFEGMGGEMRLHRLSEREKVRAELQDTMERVGRLAKESQQRRADARNLEAVRSHVFAALQALDRPEPAERAAMPDDPHARAAQLITAALMAEQLAGEMVDALASTSARIEAVPVKADLLKLAVRMDALNQAFRLVASDIVRTSAWIRPAP